MKFESIDNKEIKNGKLRLTEPSLIFSDQTEYITEHVVQLNEVGRPDLISDKYYRNTDYVDYILKYNNISNPFSLDEGDIILIPNIETPTLKWQKVKENDYVNSETEDSIKSQFMDTKRLPAKDAKRVEYLKKKASGLKNGSKEILPPNILKPGETNIQITDDSITI